MKKTLLIACLLLVLLVGGSVAFGEAFGWVGALCIVTIFIVICSFYFYRSAKLINAISRAPEGVTLHAEYLHAHIKVGMSLVKVVQIAQALGKKVSDTPDIYIWQDATHQVIVTAEDQKASQIEIVLLSSAEQTKETPSAEKA